MLLCFVTLLFIRKLFMEFMKRVSARYTKLFMTTEVIFLEKLLYDYPLLSL